MTADELRGALNLGDASTVGDWQELPEGKLMTLHVASNGVGLGVSKLVAVRVVGEQVQARNSKGDLYAFGLADVFACAIDGGEARGRKAGFSP